MAAFRGKVTAMVSNGARLFQRMGFRQTGKERVCSRKSRCPWPEGARDTGGDRTTKETGCLMAWAVRVGPDPQSSGKDIPR